MSYTQYRWTGSQIIAAWSLLTVVAASFVALPASPQASAESVSSPKPGATSSAAAGGLKDVFDRPVGTAVRARLLDHEGAAAKQYRATLLKEFSAVVAESEMKMDSLHRRPGADPRKPRPGDFDFAPADTLVNFATRNGLTVRGHTLVWHHQLPRWLRTRAYSDADLLAIMRGHIRVVAGHFGDKVAQWDVANEAFALDGTLRVACAPEAPAAGEDCGTNGVYRTQSIWQRIGEPGDDTWLVEAFRAARRATPASVKLFYNDYRTEVIDAKSDAVYKFARKLRGITTTSADGKTVPIIDGVGFQGHLWVTFTEMDSFRVNLKRFTDLGLEVQITEFDVSLTAADGSGIGKSAADGDRSMAPVSAPAWELRKQQEIYRDVAAICRQNPRCTALILWGFSDAQHWRSEYRPGVFDTVYARKPAYYELRKGLAGLAGGSPRS